MTLADMIHKLAEITTSVEPTEENAAIVVNSLFIVAWTILHIEGRGLPRHEIVDAGLLLVMEAERRVFEQLHD